MWKMDRQFKEENGSVLDKTFFFNLLVFLNVIYQTGKITENLNLALYSTSSQLGPGREGEGSR